MPAPVTPSPEPGPVRARRPAPRVLLGVLAVVGLEAAAMAVFAAAVLVELVGGGSTSVGVSVFVVVFFLGLAWLLVGCGLALWRGSRRGRAPVAGWQVFQGIIGVSLLTAGPTVAVVGGAVLVLLAAGSFCGLMTRQVVAYTSG
jgi:hypothetical protein